MLAIFKQTDTDVQFNLVKQSRNRSSKSHRSLKKSAKSHRNLKDNDKPKEVKSSAKNEPKVESNKEKSQKPNIVTEIVREITMSSDFTDFVGDINDSFSASLPRTMTSSEWRNHSPHDPHSISAEMKQKEHIEPKVTKSNKIEEKKTSEVTSTATQSDLTMEDLNGMETRISNISVVISPKKKSRPVTMEQMLYGEKSIKVAPNEIEFKPARSSSRLKSPNEEKVDCVVPSSSFITMTTHIHQFNMFIFNIKCCLF